MNETLPLRERIFPARSEKRVFDAYRKFFSIEELETTRILQIAFGALMLSVFVSIASWFYDDAISISSYEAGRHLCWAYFQSCGEWYFLQALPYGYTQSLFYMLLFGAMLLAAYLIYRREWVLAHALMAFVWLCKIGILFFLTKEFAANFDYYDVFLFAVVLFLPHKFFFARLVFVLFYFLSSTIKVHGTWILGTYFTTLQTGLPIFGDTFAPLVTGVVIIMQMIGSWFLLSQNRALQLAVFSYFALFHLYSGILVGYRYPTVALIMLVVLFGIGARFAPSIPLDRRSIAGWALVVFLFVCQFIPILIRGDQKMTLEGNAYGLFMFEANHQCVSRAEVFGTRGERRELMEDSFTSARRCDPYKYWFRLKQLCDTYRDVAGIRWTFDHSINGGPFYRIVDEENACVLEYKAFSHNEWIKLPEEGATAVGRAYKNVFQ